MKKEIEWQLFPKNMSCPWHLMEIIHAFSEQIENISSIDHYKMESNEVLSFLRSKLIYLGYEVEKSKKADEKIEVPVLFGRNGRLEKSFYADAYNFNKRTVVEVEAGRAVANYQFLKDLFEASVMADVDYCVIAVRKIYRNSEDFNKVVYFMETLFSSTKLNLPLKGVLIIGY